MLSTGGLSVTPIVGREVFGVWAFAARADKSVKSGGKVGLSLSLIGGLLCMEVPLRNGLRFSIIGADGPDSLAGVSLSQFGLVP